MTAETEHPRLLRVLAFALRHQPHAFGVALDAEGFAPLDELVVGIRFSHYDWATLTRTQLEEAVRDATPGRFEIRGEHIRARYGHSVVLGSPGERCLPPAVLYHGTPAHAVPVVLARGLRPMTRAFVHLTTHLAYAEQVAVAKGGGGILRVRADAATQAGLVFYRANEHVWLTPHVPAEFLTTEPQYTHPTES